MFLKKRAQEQEVGEKRIMHIQKLDRKKTEVGDRKEEARQLKVYRKNNGKNPKYNKTKNG
jgi:hypothetical protein